MATTIYSLEMHKEMQIDAFTTVMRVHGGWVYIFNTSSVFVPYKLTDTPPTTVKVEESNWKKRTLLDIWDKLNVRIKNVLRANAHLMTGAAYTPGYWESVTLGELDKVPDHILKSMPNFGVTSLTIFRNVIENEKTKI